MPKHFKDQESKWEFFLNAILKEGKVEVLSLKGKNLVIKSDLDGFNELRAVLSLPDILRSKVPHLNEKVKKDTVRKSYLDAKVEELTQLEGKELIARLLDGEAISLFNRLFENASNDNTKNLISTFKHTISSFNLKTAEVNLLTSTISQYSDLKIARTVLGLDSEKVDDNGIDPKTTTIDTSEIFSSNVLNGNTVVKFNYGLLVKRLYEMLREKNLINIVEKPIFSSTQDQAIYELSINTDDLLQYLYSSFNSGVIFKNEGLEKLIPMLFAPTQKNTDSIEEGHIHLILDVSGSMSTVSNEYKAKVKNLIKIIEKNIKTLTLTTFNNKITSYSYKLDNFNDRTSLHKKIENLYIGDDTNLYGALKNALEAQIANPNSLTILITDGHDTQKSISLDEVTKLSSQVSSHAELLLLGFGRYDETLFKNIAQNTGFIHHYLDSLQEITEMEQYISQVGDKRVAYEFLQESVKVFIERVPEGSISISDHLIDRTYLARAIGDSADSYSIVTGSLEENSNLVTDLTNYFNKINITQNAYPEYLNNDELNNQIPEELRSSGSVFEWHNGSDNNSHADNTVQLVDTITNHLNDSQPYWNLFIGYNHIVPVIFHQGSAYIIEGIPSGHILSNNLQNIFELFEMNSVIINTGVQDNNHVNECGHIAINALSASLTSIEHTQQVEIEALRAQIIHSFNVFYDSAGSHFSGDTENDVLKNNNVETELAGHTVFDQADL